MDFKKILEKYNKAVKYSTFALFIIAAGVFYIMSGRESDRGKDTFADIAVESTKEYIEYDSSTHSQDIYVYVCGYVNSPGVVRCEEHMRIYEAVELAGGVSEEADLSSVNLAAQLKDGDRIYIPCIGRLSSTICSPPPSVTRTFDFPATFISTNSLSLFACCPRTTCESEPYI